jgi:hypothetical protein
MVSATNGIIICFLENLKAFENVECLYFLVLGEKELPGLSCLFKKEFEEKERTNDCY